MQARAIRGRLVQAGGEIRVEYLVETYGARPSGQWRPLSLSASWKEAAPTNEVLKCTNMWRSRKSIRKARPHHYWHDDHEGVDRDLVSHPTSQDCVQPLPLEWFREAASFSVLSSRVRLPRLPLGMKVSLEAVATICLKR